MDSSFAQRMGQLTEFCKVRRWAVRAFISVFPLKLSISFFSSLSRLPVLETVSISDLRLQALSLFILLHERRIIYAATSSLPWQH